MLLKTKKLKTVLFKKKLSFEIKKLFKIFFEKNTYFQ